LFFPDPWPKLKHNKRRIVNAEFLALIHQKLTEGGYINIATDWVPYAEWIKDVFASSDQFTGEEVARPDWRPYTKFEGKGLAKDHRVSDFHYKAKV
jgi:tRNA (guanine-N7-)-methyltransferase